MDIKVIVENILTFTIGSVSISAVIIFVAKNIFNKWLETRVMEHQHELDLKSEEFRIQKEEIAEKNKIKFTKLHEDRAEVIKTLYGMLVELQDYLTIYVEDMNNRNYSEEVFENNRDKLFELIPVYINYTNRNMIFFNEKIAFNIREIEAIIIIIINLFERKPKDDNELKTNDELHMLSEIMIKEEIPKFKKDLEYDFQNLLGID